MSKATKRESAGPPVPSELPLEAAAAARDEAAVSRDEVAIDRDLAAAERDRLAQLRDTASHRNTPADRTRWGGSDRDRAAGDRARAAGDRADAAGDREHAAGDRADAAGDRGRSTRSLDEAAQELQRLAMDDLTKARRRGPGLEELQREIDRALRTKQPLSVAYVDVDGLKAMNDANGHAAGDELLVKIVDALRSDLRSYDSIIRLGGDEFLCVLPGEGIGAAQSALDHARERIVASTGHGSISVGVAQLEPADSCNELVSRADENLIANRRQRSARTRRKTPTD